MTTIALPRVIRERAHAVTGKEWRFVLAVAAALLLLTGIPYAYAYLSAPAGKQFMGIMLDVPDHLEYFSWMRELTQATLAANKLTPEPNRAIFFNLLWWGMGRLGQIMGLGYAGMFQVLRVAAGTLFLLAAYRVCSWFLDDIRQRRVAFLLMALGSGFGWVLILLKYTLGRGQLLDPLDVYVAEGNTFLNILGYPHFLAAALYIVVFDLVLRGQARGQLRYAVAAGLCALFLGWQHAYDLVTVYGVLGAYTILLALRDRRLPRYAIVATATVGLLSCWPALYSVWLTTADPLWKQVLRQFANADVFTPNPLHLVVLMGPTFVLALGAAVAARPWQLRRLDDKSLFLQTWFWTSAVLVYLPVDFRIHLLNGWQVPIALLATGALFARLGPAVSGFVARRPRLSPRRIRQALVALLLLLVLPTNLYLWSWRFVELRRHDYPYYLNTDEVAGLRWLDGHAAPEDVVLSSLTIGQYVPALSGAHAFLAHWAQTLDFPGKSKMVDDFFAAETSDAQRRQILRQYDVRYVFDGPAEAALGSYDAAHSPLLVPAFASGLVTVYEVQP